MTTMIPTGVAGNLLLSGLSPGDAERLTPHLEEVELAQGDVIVAAGDEFTYAHFPDTAVLSIVNNMLDGSSVEIGTIGNEGFVGIGIVLGVRTSLHLTICQIPGLSQRISADIFGDACASSPSLRRVFTRSTCAFIGQIGQTAACNARHDIEQRCARWLLMSHDRVGGVDTFPLKHEYLAIMLGVRRTGVTIAAGALQDAGLIRYRRGLMRIVDRAGLEARACECYQVVRDQTLNFA
ncbi:MAG: Crp/Fnr family transcriptional regulator [Gemmatimonadota bacterium]|nr:Crp/Fnr family transcriptional regulator [Gemmatimonadota bacterium]